MNKLLHQLTVGELADRVGAGESLIVVDTRPPESFESWHIESAVNVPLHPVDELNGGWNWGRVDGFVREGPVIAICGKGLFSTSFGFGLTECGYDDVEVVKGGMKDWSKLYEVVELDIGGDDLFVAQVRRHAKGCLGYVVGSRSTREAVVVDATRQIHGFELVATDTGMTVAGVLDTHIHADHVSGGQTLADRLDVSHYLGAEAAGHNVAHEFITLDDGETPAVSDYDVKAMYAPRYALDMISYLIDGRFLLTSNALFVGSIDRTELQFGDSDAATGAELLHETLHSTLLSLPDETRILPGHISVGADGRYGVAAPGELVSAPLNDLREGLSLLSMGVSAFVARVAKNTPKRPANYERVIDINAGWTSVDDEEEATEPELGPNNYAA